MKKKELFFDYDEKVNEIAKKEVEKMSDKDKEYYLSHSDYDEHHFDYGMYLRNKYIHGKLIVPMPDSMSADIFEAIIVLLKKEKEESHGGEPG